MRLGLRPDVQQAAAVRKMSRLEDGIGGLIANPHPLSEQGIRSDALPNLELLRGFEKIPPRQGTRHQGARRSDNDGRNFRLRRKRQMIGSQCRQRLQAFAPGGRAPGSILVEKRVGFREDVTRRVRHPESQLIMQLERMVGAVGDQHDGLIQVRVQGGQHRQARGARQGQTGLRPT